MNLKKQLLISLLILVTIITVAGCGGGSNDPPAPTAPTYEFAPFSSTLGILASESVSFSLTPSKDDSGYTYTWSVTAGDPTSGSKKDFTWTVPATATIGTVYTVSAKVMNGSTQVASKSWKITVAQSCTLTITGLHDGSSNPIAGATVTAFGGTKPYSGTTDSNGSVTIGSIPAGNYYIRFFASGFAPMYEQIGISGSPSISGYSLKTWAQVDVAPVTGLLDRTKGNAMCKIYDKGGSKLAGMSVTVIPTSGVKIYYFNQTKTTFDGTATDASGTAYLVLDNGKYTITASGGGYEFDPIEFQVNEGCLITWGLYATNK